MLTWDQIKMALADRKGAAVAKQTGISRQTVWSVMNGKHPPSYKTLAALSEYLERPL